MRIVFFFAFLLISISCFSQSVKKQSKNINSRKYAGYSVKLDDVLSKVSTFWSSYLDDKARMRKKRDFLEISEFNIPDAHYPEATYYSRLEEKDSVTAVWLALDPETLLAGEEGEELVSSALDQFMSGLPLAYKRYSMELKIMDTEQAIGFQMREKEGLESDIISLSKKLTKSKEERIRLQKTLENLELSILATAQRIENNKTDLEFNVVDMQKMQDLLKQYKQMLNDLQ